ncbi:MAG: DUF3800 domain-containing protein [Candidatus Goldbacteria bacterium]|nr:DUF3800 domain-containing protein [Candidatus Goldiibacteriota bacterium]
MKYYFFLDETGDHGLSYIDENYYIFLLCGCLFSEIEYEKINANFKRLKKEIFNSEDVIFVSRQIRKCEGNFQILFDLSLKEKFYSELNKIINDTDFIIISSAVNKKEHIKKYGKFAMNPYSLCLGFIMERIIFCLRNVLDARVIINVESRGKREDKMLISHYNSIIDQGTYYIKSNEFKNKIDNLNFYSKNDNINGLQVADLCAYPLARHILNKEEAYKPFEILKEKLYCNGNGKIDGWGLKIFP